MTMRKPLFLAAAIAATAMRGRHQHHRQRRLRQRPNHYLPAGLRDQRAAESHGIDFQPHASSITAAMPCRRPRSPAPPAWSLTAQAVLSARTVPRDSEFYEEAEIPAADRARLSDYGRGTGLDRGHLAPSGDFPDDVAVFNKPL